MFKVIFISTILLFSLKGSDWTLKKEKDGIQIHTRSVQGSSFEEFKGIVFIENTNIPDILDVLFDVKSYTELFPDCIEAENIERYGEYHQIHYTVTKGPWPVDDRDGVYEMKAEIAENGEEALVKLFTRSDKLELKKKRVRLKNGVGSWKLEKTGDQRIRVQFQFHGEVGGGVPAWIANTFIVSYPFGTLENLRNRLDKQKK